MIENNTIMSEGLFLLNGQPVLITPQSSDKNILRKSEISFPQENVNLAEIFSRRPSISQNVTRTSRLLSLSNNKQVELISEEDSDDISEFLRFNQNSPPKRVSETLSSHHNGSLRETYNDNSYVSFPNGKLSLDTCNSKIDIPVANNLFSLKTTDHIGTSPIKEANLDSSQSNSSILALVQIPVGSLQAVPLSCNNLKQLGVDLTQLNDPQSESVHEQQKSIQFIGSTGINTNNSESNPKISSRSKVKISQNKMAILKLNQNNKESNSLVKSNLKINQNDSNSRSTIPKKKDMKCLKSIAKVSKIDPNSYTSQNSLLSSVLKEKLLKLKSIETTQDPEDVEVDVCSTDSNPPLLGQSVFNWDTLASKPAAPSRPKVKTNIKPKSSPKKIKPKRQSIDQPKTITKSQNNVKNSNSNLTNSSEPIVIKNSTGCKRFRGDTSLQTSGEPVRVSITTGIHSKKRVSNSLDCDISCNSDSNINSGITSIVYSSATTIDFETQEKELPGSDSSKPLGSMENPIQILKQGAAYQALQPIEERHIEQINNLIQERKIYNCNGIFNSNSRPKIVFKYVNAEGNLRTSPESYIPDDDEEIDVEVTVVESDKEREERLRGKYRDTSGDDSSPDIIEVDDTDKKVKRPIASRTRSGRISRPPRHMLKDLGHTTIANTENMIQIGPTKENEDLNTQSAISPFEEIQLADRKKKINFKMATRLRYTCATCGKLYMGSKMEAHLLKFPNHRACLDDSSTNGSQPQLSTSFSALKSLSVATTTNTATVTTASTNLVSNATAAISPTPGTAASEDPGAEPSMPLETQTPGVDLEVIKNIADSANESSTATPMVNTLSNQDTDPLSNEGLDGTPSTNTVRRGRGRGRGRWRGRGRGRGGSSAAVPKPKPPEVVSCPQQSLDVLEKVLRNYDILDVMKVLWKILGNTMTVWSLVALLAQVCSGSTVSRLQDTVQMVVDLLKSCRKIIQEKTIPVPSVNFNKNMDMGFAQIIEENVAFGDCPLLEKTVQDGEGKLPKENVLKVSREMAISIGISEGVYKIKEEPKNAPESKDIEDSCQNTDKLLPIPTVVEKPTPPVINNHNGLDTIDVPSKIVSDSNQIDNNIFSLESLNDNITSPDVFKSPTSSQDVTLNTPDPKNSDARLLDKSPPILSDSHLLSSNNLPSFKSTSDISTYVTSATEIISNGSKLSNVYVNSSGKKQSHQPPIMSSISNDDDYLSSLNLGKSNIDSLLNENLQKRKNESAGKVPEVLENNLCSINTFNPVNENAIPFSSCDLPLTMTDNPVPKDHHKKTPISINNHIGPFRGKNIDTLGDCNSMINQQSILSDIPCKNHEVIISSKPKNILSTDPVFSMDSLESFKNGLNYHLEDNSRSNAFSMPTTSTSRKRIYGNHTDKYKLDTKLPENQQQNMSFDNGIDDNHPSKKAKLGGSSPISSAPNLLESNSIFSLDSLDGFKVSEDISTLVSSSPMSTSNAVSRDLFKCLCDSDKTFTAVTTNSCSMDKTINTPIPSYNSDRESDSDGLQTPKKLNLNSVLNLCEKSQDSFDSNSLFSIGSYSFKEVCNLTSNENKDLPAHNEPKSVGSKTDLPCSSELIAQPLTDNFNINKCQNSTSSTVPPKFKSTFVPATSSPPNFTNSIEFEKSHTSLSPPADFSSFLVPLPPYTGYRHNTIANMHNSISSFSSSHTTPSPPLTYIPSLSPVSSSSFTPIKSPISYTPSLSPTMSATFASSLTPSPTFKNMFCNFSSCSTVTNPKQTHFTHPATSSFSPSFISSSYASALIPSLSPTFSFASFPSISTSYSNSATPVMNCSSETVKSPRSSPNCHITSHNKKSPTSSNPMFVSTFKPASISSAVSPFSALMDSVCLMSNNPYTSPASTSYSTNSITYATPSVDFADFGKRSLNECFTSSTISPSIIPPNTLSSSNEFSQPIQISSADSSKLPNNYYSKSNTSILPNKPAAPTFCSTFVPVVTSSICLPDVTACFTTHNNSQNFNEPYTTSCNPTTHVGPVKTFDSFNSSSYTSTPLTSNSHINNQSMDTMTDRDTPNLIASPPLTSCLDLPVLESGLSNSANLVQDSTSMSQMSLGDIDISAVDIPNLLDAGAGLIDNSNGDVNDCNTDKLLDPSGPDTSDLRDVFMKLQEVTSIRSSTSNNCNAAKLIEPSGDASDLSDVFMKFQAVSSLRSSANSGTMLQNHLPTNAGLIQNNSIRSSTNKINMPISSTPCANMLHYREDISKSKDNGLITTFTDALASNIESISNKLPNNESN